MIASPGARGDPGVVRVAHRQTLCGGANMHLFSFVRDAHVVETMVESDLACLGDAEGEKGS
jgi:hypothetical protein